MPVLSADLDYLGTVQVNHLLELVDRSQGKDKYQAIDKWAKQLDALHSTVINKLQS